ncbi:MAG TPA: SRPBCC family protein [Thiolinea sp.]|nr:SRPBCC family protein [Thiolinea sp.]
MNSTIAQNSKIPLIHEFLNHHSTFALVNEFEIDAPLEQVWDVLIQPENWPQWWRYVESVELIEAGGVNDLNALRKARWKTALLYRVEFLVRTVIVEVPYNIILNTEGDVHGVGRWQLESTSKGTYLRYIWCIKFEKSWLRWFAPLLKPAFTWNHHKVMRAGANGLAQRLNSNLTSYRSINLKSAKAQFEQV